MSTHYFTDRLPLILAGYPFTVPEFEKLCGSIDNIGLERTKEGKVIMHAPSGGFTSRANSEILRQLANWCVEYGQGHVYDSNGGFVLPDTSIMAPDAAWVSPERLALLKPSAGEHLLPLCPDFVIELRSASDSLKEQKTKMERWIDNGILLGWLIDPKTKTVYVYRSTQIRLPSIGLPFQGDAIAADGISKAGTNEFLLDLARVWRCYE